MFILDTARMACIIRIFSYLVRSQNLSTTSINARLIVGCYCFQWHAVNQVQFTITQPISCNQLVYLQRNFGVGTNSHTDEIVRLYVWHIQLLPPRSLLCWSKLGSGEPWEELNCVLWEIQHRPAPRTSGPYQVQLGQWKRIGFDTALVTHIRVAQLGFNLLRLIDFHVQLRPLEIFAGKYLGPAMTSINFAVIRIWSSVAWSGYCRIGFCGNRGRKNRFDLHKRWNRILRCYR